MEVHNTVQESVTKTIPKKKTCKEGNWLSEEVLQIAEDWEHMYTHGWFMSTYGKNHYNIVK